MWLASFHVTMCMTISIRRHIVLLCLVLLGSMVSLQAQLVISLVDDQSFDGSKYPLYAATVKATLNGQPFVLSPDNVLIREDIYISHPLDVSTPTGGQQTIRWYSRNRDDQGGKATLVVFSSTQATSIDIDSAVGMHFQRQVSQVRLLNSKYKPLREIAFGTVTPGDSVVGRYDCVAVNSPIDDQLIPYKVRIDSIKTETPAFHVHWTGGPGCATLPGNIVLQLDYLMEVTFVPTSTQYYHDVLTIYYSGGAVEHVALSGNTFALPTRTVLNLLSPNGGEILAPCQRVPVRWTGATKGSTTVAEFSTDGGTTWDEIGRTTDTSLVWTVPDSPTNSLRLRVSSLSQDLTETSLAFASQAVCDYVAFSPDSKTLLGLYRNSTAISFDVQTAQVKSRWNYRADGQTNVQTQPFGGAFSSATQFFVAYRSTSRQAKSDTLCFFDTTTPTALSSVALDSNQRFKAALIDSSRTSIVLVSQLSPSLTLLNATDGSFQRSVPFSAPVSAVSLGKTQAVVALMDGTINVMDIPAWTVSKSYQFTGMPLMDQILLTPDNERIVVGCHASGFSVNEVPLSDGYVIDIASSLIVRTERKSSTSPLCVSANPTSRYVLFGYIATPQAPIWDLPPNQVYSSIITHSGSLTDLAFSPSGLMIASSANASDNLKLKQFVYPEIDYSDSTCRIVRQSLTSLSAQIEPTYAFSSRDTVLTLNLCNTGIVPVVIDNAWLERSSHFQLQGGFVGDTIAVNSCAHVPIRFNPSDTGTLSDILHVTSCAASFQLTVSGYGIPRSLGLPDTIDVGDVCPGVVVDTNLTIVSNADPVPIVINQAYLSDDANSWFSIITRVDDDTVAAKQSLSLHVQFKAKSVGTQTKVLLVYYGGQQRLYGRIVLRGRGAGSEIVVSPPTVAFIPDQLQRRVVLHNTNDNPVLLNALGIVPSGAFSNDPITLPTTIAPHDSLVVTLHWNDTTVNSATLNALIAPCSVPMGITLTRYTGSALLSLSTVKADPTGNATIPVRLHISENVSYAAPRSLEAEFTMNPRLFLPQSVRSDLGTATLTRNDIVNDQRIIGFRVVADFPLKDTTVAYIDGVAGLAETDHCPMSFSAASSYFGSTVSTQTIDGVFQLINLCGDRRIVQSGTLSIISLSPQPAGDLAHLNVVAGSDQAATIELYNTTGERILQQNVQLQSGGQDLPFDTSTLNNGSYTIVLRSASGVSTAVLIVSR